MTVPIPSGESLSRRQLLYLGALGSLGLVVGQGGLLGKVAQAGSLPDEPVKIDHGPQLFVDDWLVDNRFAVRVAAEQVLHRHHAPEKHGEQPVMVDPETFPSGHALRFDAEAGLFRVWYQANVPLHVGQDPMKGHTMGFRHVRYAESADGLNWTLPKLGLHEFRGSKQNNICFIRPGQFQMDRGAGISSLHFLQEGDMPEADRRGYKYLMTYTLRGGGGSEEDKPQVYLVGSRDGVHWDRQAQVSIVTGRVSDGWMGYVYDPQRKIYVGYCRPRDRYESGQLSSPTNADFQPNADPRRNELLYSGVVRRIGRIETDSLWSPQELWARTVLLPDARDLRQGATAHMRMTPRWYGGVYFGFLTPYVPKEVVWTELAFSRDGMSFQRMADPVVTPGGPASWDSQQAWAVSDWVEVGDEWWFTYFGTNAGPNTPVQTDTTRALGLLRLRKEGFVSLESPRGGGVVVTRLLRWPGGDLVVNCNAAQCEMRVRVSDRSREAVAGFNYADCQPVAGDSVAHRVNFSGGSMDCLRGEAVRLEFFFSGPANLYAFRAAG